MTDRPLDPTELALLRAADGLGPDVPGAAGLRAVGEQLRSALVQPVSVADDVMLAVMLNDAVRVPSAAESVADDVMLAVMLNDAVRVPPGAASVADDVMLAVSVNDAVRPAHEVDVADDVMLAVMLNDAVRVPPGAASVADDVMAQLDERVATMPRWVSLGVPALGLAAALAAAVLLAVLAPWAQVAPKAVVAEVELPVLTLAKFNQAEVEDLVVADGATAQVMQFEEGGPTIIFVEEQG